MSNLSTWRICCGIVPCAIFTLCVPFLTWQNKIQLSTTLKYDQQLTFSAALPPNKSNIIIMSNGTNPLNKTLYMTVRNTGRLGNLMFQYSVLFAITRNKSVWTPCLDYDQFHILLDLFIDRLSIRNCSLSSLQNSRGVSDAGVYKNFDLMIPRLRKLPHRNITLVGYYQSHKYFRRVKGEIRNEFTLPHELRENVRDYFRRITPARWLNESYTRVGIHVRRTTMITERAIKLNGVVPSNPEYYHHAMEYFKTRHHNVQFIVTSDDMEWSRKYINGDFVEYSDFNYRTDFAILTLSDHVITSVGTFSWWAGWLCRGTTLYHDVSPPQGTQWAIKMSGNRWIPPNDKFNRWIPIK